MKKNKILNVGLVFCVLNFLLISFASAQDTNTELKEPAAALSAQNEEQADEEIEIQEPALAAGYVTLDFNEADIRNVLKIISYKSGFNIVTTPEVMGNVTIRLVDVPWERALDIILKTYGFGYERQGNVILVTKMENIAKIQSEEPLKTEIFQLKFLDAQDAERSLIPLLSIRGKISVLYSKGQKGWQFGTFKIGKEQVTTGALEAEDEKQATTRTETVSIERNPEGRPVSNKLEFDPAVKSKTLIITDTASAMDRIRNFLEQIDKMPKQVLIETKIMEVNRDLLKDIGFDWGTGTSGAHGYKTAPGDVILDHKDNKSVAGRNLASEFTPSLFGPKETAFLGTYPYQAGLEVLFKKLNGTQFEVIMHALEEDAHTNTLSAPRILTLDNQEASILVGFHTPILSSTVTAASNSTGPTMSQTLDYYQEIGIRLNVVPQVSEEGYINMILHPSVTSSSSNVTASNVAGTGADAITSTVNYPVIDVREAQTQIIMKDGETIVIGGLMKDVKSKETIGVPFLSKIPLLGNIFKREINDITKVDLLIFITAHIVKEDEWGPEKIAQLERSMGRGSKKPRRATPASSVRSK